MIERLKRYLSRRHDDWFAPADPRSLAIARILVFSFIWPDWGHGRTLALAKLGENVWRPISTFELLGLGPPSLAQAQLIDAVLWGSCLLALIGLAFPVSALVCGLTWLYAVGLPHNFGKLNHNNLIALVPLLLAFSRAADVWSVDACLRRRFKPESVRAGPGAEYRWPIMAISVLLLTLFGAAGFSKLIKTGWDWAFSDSFRLMLLRHHFTGSPPTRLGVWLADSANLCRGIAFGALALELAAVLGLFSAWLRHGLILSYAALRVGIYLTLGVSFTLMVPIFLCVVPWAWFLRRAEPLLPLPRAPKAVRPRAASPTTTLE